MPSITFPLPAQMEVVVVSPPVDISGWHAVDSVYVETYWLPVIGPTAWAAARRIYSCASPDAFDQYRVHISEHLARMVGVGTPHLERALSRLAMFGLARWVRQDESAFLMAMGAWPPLPRRHADRLSDFLPIP